LVSFSSVLFTLAVFLLVGLPFALAWGWLRWWKQAGKRNLFAILSLIGFAFATGSALLAAALPIYARAMGGFPYYDPTLLRIYRCGAMLSVVGIGFGVAGLWKPNSLRWHAPACAVGALLWWFMEASSE